MKCPYRKVCKEFNKESKECMKQISYNWVEGKAYCGLQKEYEKNKQ